MEIDGVRVVLIQDGKQSPAIDFKDAIGYDANNPNGCLTIVAKVDERGPDGKIQDLPVQKVTYAPGTWHHVELLNPIGNKVIRTPSLVVPMGGKLNA